MPLPRIKRFGFPGGNRNIGFGRPMGAVPRPGFPGMRQPPRSDPSFQLKGFQRPQFDTSVMLGGHARFDPGQGGQTPPPAQGQGQDWGGFSGSDPVLIRYRAMAARQRAEAEAGARRQRERLAIEFGLPELALELGLGETIAKAARENPLSQLAGIRREGEQKRTGLEGELNERNLHFGGYRGTKLGELAQAILGQEGEARSGAADYSNDISSNLIAAQMSADEMELDAETNAYARWLASGQFGGAPGGGGAGGAAGGGADGQGGTARDSWWRGGGFGSGGGGEDYANYQNRVYEALARQRRQGGLPGDIRQWIFG